MTQPRGFIGIIVILIISGVLVWLALYGAPWIPHVVINQEASSTPAIGGTSQSNVQSGAPITGRYEITEPDNGKTFAYGVTSRFAVILDGSRYPMPPACVPAGVVGTVSNAPTTQPPYVAASFEAVASGTCTITTRDFSATIVVE